jgi:hypothetical protein
MSWWCIGDAPPLLPLPATSTKLSYTPYDVIGSLRPTSVRRPRGRGWDRRLHLSPALTVGPTRKYLGKPILAW